MKRQIRRKLTSFMLILTLFVAFLLAMKQTAFAKREDFATISAGSWHSAAITTNGSLYMWGSNTHGQIGNNLVGINYRQTTPLMISLENKRVISVSAGGAHTAAITEDGSLYVWGLNNRRQVCPADGNEKLAVSAPYKVMDNVAFVSCSDFRTMAITTSGDLYEWGANELDFFDTDQINTRKTSDITTPKMIMSNVLFVAAGEDNSFIIKTDFSLWARGQNKYGQLGTGDMTDRNSWVEINNAYINKNVTYISANRTTAVITTDGSLYMWGKNDSGQLGNGNTIDSQTPVKIMDNVDSVSTNQHTVAVKSDGSLWAWGRNNYGQIGNGGSGNNVLSPIRVMDGVAIASAGGYHTMIHTTSNSLWVSGRNDDGQLGDGTYPNSHYTPMEVPSMSGSVHAPYHNVTFVDSQNKAILKIQRKVSHGGSATAPNLPVREGYMVTWDKSFNNITRNLTITAQYAQLYTTTVSVPQVNNTAPNEGTVTNPPAVIQGATVSLPMVTAKAGFAFSKWEVIGGGVTITNQTSASNASFVMGSANVIINAVFAPAPLTFGNQTLSDGTAGIAYSANVMAATGGSGSYQYSSDEVPEGLTLSSQGVISGVPIAAVFAHDFSVTAIDTVSGANADAKYTITINKGQQASLEVNAITGKKYGDMDFQLTTIGGSGTGAVTYTLVTGQATVTSNGIVTIGGAGVIIVTATKAADEKYEAVTSEQQTIVIDKAQQVDLAIKLVSGAPPFQLYVTGGSTSGVVTFEVVSGSGIVDSDGKVTITGDGNIMVRATMAGDNNYLPITSDDLTISQYKFTVTFIYYNGSEIEPQEVGHLGFVEEPKVQEIQGNSFLGWYKDAALTAKWVFETDRVTDNITLYAKWEQIITVRWDPQGGSAINTVKYNTQIVGANYNIPTTSYGNNVFRGWWLNNTELKSDRIVDAKDDKANIIANWTILAPVSDKGSEYIRTTSTIDVLTNDDIVTDENPPLVAAWNNPYTDVSDTDWFYDAVQFATEAGLMKGTSSISFSPSNTLTRAMIVTILYRLEGEPEVSGDIPFLDVSEDEWYSDAILWASQNGIVLGYGNGYFGINDTITREQIVVILYRYAKDKGLDVNASTDLSEFTDMTEISDWALIAMKWAVAESLIEGRSGNNIAPIDAPTRAEAAVIFKRYMEGISK
ncbi:MAG: S-layer homology domain-containing protein [Oscillospiraceae bacterium]|nr:S-layer homology domain-containing protein [Oscillospiraceae bacterium]